MHIRRISVAKYPYPYPIRIRENCGYPQNIYPQIHIRASLVVVVTRLAKSRNGPKMVPCLLTSTDR